MSGSSIGKTWSEREKLRFVLLYNQGKDLQTIATAMGRGYGAIKQRCVIMDLTITGRTRATASAEVTTDRCRHCDALLFFLVKDYLAGNRCYRSECVLMRPVANNYAERTMAGVSFDFSSNE